MAKVLIFFPHSFWYFAFYFLFLKDFHFLQVDIWRQENRNDFIFFRPKTEEDPEGDISFLDDAGDSDEEGIDAECVRPEGSTVSTNMLFIYMSEMQLKVLKRSVFRS